MKEYLINVTAGVIVLAVAFVYYYGHDLIYRLMITGPSSVMQLAGR